MQQLEGQVVWKSNTLGLYTMTLGESQTELRSGYFRTLLGRLQKEQSVPVTLTFTPYGAVNGIAEADIQVRARNTIRNSNYYYSAQPADFKPGAFAGFGDQALYRRA